MRSGIFDGIYKLKKPLKKKSSKFWLWGILLVLAINLFYFGFTRAAKIASNVDLLPLFGNGKFLVLFQNNSELRSSGGFIGSYAVLEVKDFEVKNLSFNTNIYALDRQFARENYVEAPKPIEKMLKGETWSLRDANYAASFPRASQDILNFYEKETGDQVDGIIGLNAKVIQDLLVMTGPINLEKYNLQISAENFYNETQYQVEKAYYESPENWVVNEPKTFLKDLYPEVLARAMKNKIGLWRLLKKELAQKEIIFYFQDLNKQAILERQNWAGKILTEPELKDLFAQSLPADYLYINSNSYSGNKSSLSVKQEIDYQLSITDEYGPKMLQADLKITRVHEGSDDWPDGTNTTWMRIFTPTSSQFLQGTLNKKDVSSHIEVGTDESKNYFGLEVVTEPNEVNILEITYLIPWSSSYHLLVQKQPGEIGDTLQVSFEDKILFNGILDGDKKILLNS